MQWILYVVVWSLFVVGSGYALMNGEDHDEDGQAGRQDASRDHDGDPASRVAAGIRALRKRGTLPAGEHTGPRARRPAAVLWEDPAARQRQGSVQPAA